MNRIMRRPMFRKGGSAGEGITSGLAPRQGYATNEDNTVKQNDSSKVQFRDANLQQLMDMSKQYGFQAPPMQPDNSLNNFKIDFGLDLVGRSPSGNIFQTAALAAKEPFSNFRTSRAAYNKGINDRAINKYNSESDMFKTLIGAQADILGSEGGSKQYRDIVISQKLEEIIPKIEDECIFFLDGHYSGNNATPDYILEEEKLKDYAYRTGNKEKIFDISDIPEQGVLKSCSISAINCVLTLFAISEDSLARLNSSSIFFRSVMSI